MLITAKVTEIVTVTKEIRIGIADDATDEQIRERVRENAYKTLVTQGNDWELEGSDGLSIEILERNGKPVS
jgi:hypothetical protein